MYFTIDSLGTAASYPSKEIGRESFPTFFLRVAGGYTQADD